MKTLLIMYTDAFLILATFDIFPGPTMVCGTLPAPTMSSYVSQARKVKQKGIVRELKVVHSVTRRGLDTLTTEEVQLPRRDSQKASSSRTRTQSSSPAKRRKLDVFDAEPLPCHLEGHDDYEKRRTLVLILLS
jgi:hypothetical protein